MIYLIDDNQNKHRKIIGIDFVNNGVFVDVLAPV